MLFQPKSDLILLFLADDIANLTLLVQVPDLGTFNPLMEGAGPDDWLDSSMDDFGCLNWTG